MNERRVCGGVRDLYGLSKVLRGRSWNPNTVLVLAQPVLPPFPRIGAWVFGTLFDTLGRTGCGASRREAGFLWGLQEVKKASRPLIGGADAVRG